MGVTPGLDTPTVQRVGDVPTGGQTIFLAKTNRMTYLNSTLQRFVIEVVGT